MAVAVPRLCLGLLSVLLFVGTAPAHGATLRNSEEMKELAEKVLSRVVVGDIERAFTVARPYWPFPESELEALASRTAQQRAQMAGRLGKSLGFVLVRRDTLTDVFLRFTYVEKCEHTGLRWLFTFYRAKDTWKLHSLLWDEDIARLFPSSH